MAAKMAFSFLNEIMNFWSRFVLPKNQDFILGHEATAIEATEDGGSDVSGVRKPELVAGSQAVGQKLRLAAEGSQKL